MLDAVAAKVARGPIEDVDGVLVRALRLDRDLSIMDFGARLGKEKATIQRWEKGFVDEITWLGMLAKFGLPPSWEPGPALLERATREIHTLREAARRKGAPKRRRAPH